jgi:hypothetical protein
MNLKTKKLLRKMGKSVLSREDWLASKIPVKARIEECAEDGVVAVIESGRDCDGVQYWGRTHTIPATLTHYQRLCDTIGDWADGPYWLEVERPSVKVQYGSRDLTMEAFEDGHPHVLYT